MKPTPLINSRHNTKRTLPLTDYNYQPTLETPAATVKTNRSAQELRGFWRLATGFFSVEAKLDYASELVLFSLITAISAWPIIMMIEAVTRMVRNY